MPVNERERKSTATAMSVSATVIIFILRGGSNFAGVRTPPFCEPGVRFSTSETMQVWRYALRSYPSLLGEKIVAQKHDTQIDRQAHTHRVNHT